MAFFSRKAPTTPTLPAAALPPLHAIVVERELAVPINSAWERMSDLSIAHRYVPGTTATEIRTEIKSGLGAVRRVYSGAKRWVDETVMQWNEGKGFWLSVHRGRLGRMPAPLDSIWFYYGLEPSARKDHCNVRLAFCYRLRGGIYLAALRPLLHLLFRMNMNRIARSLKIYYEIGCYVHDSYDKQ